ncbi:MAG TPA: hypothetical protein VJ907_03225 [Halanaerobiales bacterium]|nr:hypothetical protein [Halanaerobiales bacterium]
MEKIIKAGNYLILIPIFMIDNKSSFTRNKAFQIIMNKISKFPFKID